MADDLTGARRAAGGAAAAPGRAARGGVGRLLPKALLTPAVLTLFLWMIVPLVMTIWFSVVRYNLMQPGDKDFVGLENWHYFLTDPDFGPAVGNTLMLLGSVITMVAWQWLPFACLIFMTSLQSMDRDQLEAAGMEGANAFQKFWYLYLPHLSRPVAVVVMIEMIFLTSVFAEIFTTTGGGPGNESTNLAFLNFKQALMNFDVGVAWAGALVAVVLANIAAVFLIRMVGKNLDK